MFSNSVVWPGAVTWYTSKSLPAAETTSGSSRAALTLTAPTLSRLKSSGLASMPLTPFLSSTTSKFWPRAKS